MHEPRKFFFYKPSPKPVWPADGQVTGNLPEKLKCGRAGSAIQVNVRVFLESPLALPSPLESEFAHFTSSVSLTSTSSRLSLPAMFQADLPLFYSSSWGRE